MAVVKTKPIKLYSTSSVDVDRIKSNITLIVEELKNIANQYGLSTSTSYCYTNEDTRFVKDIHEYGSTEIVFSSKNSDLGRAIVSVKSKSKFLRDGSLNVIFFGNFKKFNFLTNNMQSLSKSTIEDYSLLNSCIKQVKKIDTYNTISSSLTNRSKSQAIRYISDNYGETIGHYTQFISETASNIKNDKISLNNISRALYTAVASEKVFAAADNNNNDFSKKSVEIQVSSAIYSYLDDFYGEDNYEIKNSINVSNNANALFPAISGHITAYSKDSNIKLKIIVSGNVNMENGSIIDNGYTVEGEFINHTPVAKDDDNNTIEDRKVCAEVNVKQFIKDTITILNEVPADFKFRKNNVLRNITKEINNKIQRVSNVIKQSSAYKNGFNGFNFFVNMIDDVDIRYIASNIDRGQYYSNLSYDVDASVIGLEEKVNVKYNDTYGETYFMSLNFDQNSESEVKLSELGEVVDSIKDFTNKIINLYNVKK
jgi:hypothetical protein